MYKSLYYIHVQVNVLYTRTCTSQCTIYTYMYKSMYYIHVHVHVQVNVLYTCTCTSQCTIYMYMYKSMYYIHVYVQVNVLYTHIYTMYLGGYNKEGCFRREFIQCFL